jgi:hypothetical protein
MFAVAAIAKVHAKASRHATRDYEWIAREILAEAAAVVPPRTGSSARRAATSCSRS